MYYINVQNVYWQWNIGKVKHLYFSDLSNGVGEMR